MKKYVVMILVIMVLMLMVQPVAANSTSLITYSDKKYFELQYDSKLWGIIPNDKLHVDLKVSEYSNARAHFYLKPLSSTGISPRISIQVYGRGIGQNAQTKINADSIREVSRWYGVEKVSGKKINIEQSKDASELLITFNDQVQREINFTLNDKMYSINLLTKKNDKNFKTYANVQDAMIKSMKLYATKKVNITLNGKVIQFPDAKPYVDENNRTLIPLRFISENLGARVSWDDYDRRVTIRVQDKVINIPMGWHYYDVDGEQKRMDTASVMFDGRTYVPLRFISEELGASVIWDSATQTIHLTTK